MILAVGLSYMAFIMLRYFPFVPNLLKGLGFFVCFSTFSSSIEMIIQFLFFILLMCITLIWVVSGFGIRAK